MNLNFKLLPLSFDSNSFLFILINNETFYLIFLTGLCISCQIYTSLLCLDFGTLFLLESLLKRAIWSPFLLRTFINWTQNSCSLSTRFSIGVCLHCCQLLQSLWISLNANWWVLSPLFGLYRSLFNYRAFSFYFRRIAESTYSSFY